VLSDRDFNGDDGCNREVSEAGMNGADLITETTSEQALPLLLTTDEVATLLRTTRKAIYSMVERGQLPGVRKIGRRVLFRSRPLLDYLDGKCRVPSDRSIR